MILKKITYCVTSAFTLLFFAVPASASPVLETKLTGEIVSGPLNFTELPKPIHFETVTLDGNSHNLSKQIDVTVSDYRGLKNGFSLYVHRKNGTSTLPKGATLKLTSQPDLYRKNIDSSILRSDKRGKIPIKRYYDLEKYEITSVNNHRQKILGTSCGPSEPEEDYQIEIAFTMRYRAATPLDVATKITAELSLPKKAKAGSFEESLVWSFTASP